MKKLFQLRDTRTNTNVPNLFFTDKFKAKEKRAELNPKDSADREVMHYVVTPGPDHYKNI